MITRKNSNRLWRFFLVAGAIMILVATYYKLQNPQAQALLNQGIVMCQNTPMNTNDSAGLISATN